MRLIYCDSVFDPKAIDPDYEAEKQAAVQAGFNFSLISYEELTDGNLSKALRLVKPLESKTSGLYRGWMLTPNQYQQLYEGLLARNIELINTPAAYRHCHYLPESYEIIASQTPKSKWTTQLNETAILELARQFDDRPLIVKDFVKSEKHDWEEACFIPNASDAEKVKSVVNRLLELRGDALNQGLVFRQFEELEFLTKHSKSGMPLTKEFRLFFLKGKLLKVMDYWDEGTYGETQPELEKFVDLAQKVQSNFFTMDIAQKKDGEWIIIELGDGQVAGLPENEDGFVFYQKLVTNTI